MTFDEAFEQVEYSVDYCDDNAFDKWCELLNDLRQEYAPTIEMTKEQRKGLLFDGKGRETPHKNFVFMKEVQKLNEKNINIDILMSAFVHQETIKIVDE